MRPTTVFGPRRPIIFQHTGGDPPPRPRQIPHIARPREAFEALHLGGRLILPGPHGGPPATPLVSSQLPGTAIVAREVDYAQSLLLGGRVWSAASAAPPPPPPPEPPRVATVARAEPPPLGHLAGAATIAPWGIAQPVQRPTAAVPRIARPEERPFEPGAFLRSSSRAPMQYLPAARPLVARTEEARPADGRAQVAGTGSGRGFGVPRRPARPVVARSEEPIPESGRGPLVKPVRFPTDPPAPENTVKIPRPAVVAAAEVRASAPGFALIGKPPTAALTAGQPAGVVRVAVAENAPPFPGWIFARRRPLVPSERLRTRPVIAFAESPPPFAGDVVAWRVRLGHPPPARFVATVARAEEPPPESGPPFRTRPGTESLAAQQMPGRVVVAWSEHPRPDWTLRGLAIVFTGYRAGATPPSSAGWRAAGAVKRADIQSRAVRRVPRTNMITLAYQTKTKTPSEALVLVFDYSNWPEVVGGATVTDAVVSGPGGAALSGLVAGTPAVLAAAATVDHLGNTVAAGKGVQVTLFGGSDGSDVLVECAATFSSGDVPRCIQAKIAVRNAV